MERFFLKCVDDKMHDIPHRVLHLEDLRTLVKQDHELRWGLEPRGSLSIRNSGGKFSELPPQEGFFWILAPENGFAICYEFDEGIAIHAPEEQCIISKVQRFAQLLGAKVFHV